MFVPPFSQPFPPLFASAEEEQSYIDKVKSIFGDSLIAYWPLNETSGAVARNLSGHAFNGAYTGVDLGQTGIGDGKTAPYFDGANDYVNIYSAGLASAFNGAAGTLMIWVKVANAGVWTDGTARRVCTFTKDATNYIQIRRDPVNGRLYLIRSASGTVTARNIEGLSTTDYACFVLTWDKIADEVRGYVDGAQSGGTLTGLGVFADSPAIMAIGSNSGTSAALPWHGNLAHCAIGNTALKPSQIRDLSFIGEKPEDTIVFTSTNETITPVIALAAGAPTPWWCVTEADGTEYIYTTADFTHTRSVAGNMTITLGHEVYPYVTRMYLHDNGLTGTFTAAMLAELTALERLYLYSNAALVCDFTLADMPSSMTYILVHGTSALTNISGPITDMPANFRYINAHNTSSSIHGDFVNLPATMTTIIVYNTDCAFTGTLSDLPANMYLLRVDGTDSTITGGSTPMVALGIDYLYLNSMDMSQSDVNSLYDRIYADRALFLSGTHYLHTGGTNPDPLGVYHDATPPTTALEKWFKLVNDPDGEGFYKWTGAY